MKLISSIIFLILISSNTLALDIYKCKKNNNTLIGFCGYSGWCKDKNGNKISKWNYTRPRYADKNFNEYDYTIIRDDDRITITNKKGYKETFTKKDKDISSLLSAPKSFHASKSGYGYYQMFYYHYGNFYYIRNTIPYLSVWSGSCKKQ